MPTLYVETSIVSYLRGRPSSQVVAAARQLLTQRWWGAERANYELVTSQYVLDEAADGDSALAQSRLETLAGVPILPVEGAILDIAEEILRKAILPRSASVDALHIAMVAHHQVDYLLRGTARISRMPESFPRFLAYWTARDSRGRSSARRRSC